MYPAQQALFFIYGRVITALFIIHGCYIQFHFTLVTALYYFHEIRENDPLRNTPLSKNDPLKPIKILKMIPQQNAPPPPPPYSHRGGSRIFFRRGCTRLLLYFNTNKPHRIPVVLENSRSFQGGVRTPCTLPLDPPLSHIKDQPPTVLRLGIQEFYWSRSTLARSGSPH